MSRSGYTDDYDEDGTGGLWRGAVTSAIKGKRGQAALVALAEAMDAMPVKTLAAESLVNADGEFCTLGVLGAARGMDMSDIDPDDWDQVAKAFGLAPAMVREIVYENDEHCDGMKWARWEVCGPMRYFYPHWERHSRSGRIPTSEGPGAARWKRMRAWVQQHIDPAAQRVTAREGMKNA